MNISRVILSIVSILFLYLLFYKWHSLVPIHKVPEYFKRAALYREYMKWECLLGTPAILVLAALFTLINPVKKKLVMLNQSIDKIAGGRFLFGVSALFLISALVTSKLVIGATPRVLDGFNYLFQAKNFALGQFYAPAPPIPELFQFPFVIMRDGRWYGSVYPGFPILLSLGVLIHLPWIINPMLGAVAIYFIYKTGQEMYGESLARRAVLLLGVSPFFRMMCSIFLAHAASIFWLTLAVYSFIRWAGATGHPASRYSLLAGLGVGFAVITRPQAAAVILTPFSGWGFFLLLRRKIAYRHVILFFIVVALFAGFLAVYNWKVTGDPMLNPRYFVDPGRRLGFGSDLGEPLPGGRRSGHSLHKGLQNISVLLNLLNSDLLGWGACGLAGIVIVLVVTGGCFPPVQTFDLLLMAGFLLNVFLYIFYFTPSPNFGPRYLSESIPFVMFLLLRGVKKIQALSNKFFPGDSVSAFFMASALGLFGLSIFLFLPVHTRHYGILPETLNYESLPEAVKAMDEGVVIVPNVLYRMNVFSWNSPNLDGIIFVPGKGNKIREQISSHFPHHRIIQLERKNGNSIDYREFQHVDSKGLKTQ